MLQLEADGFKIGIFRLFTDIIIPHHIHFMYLYYLSVTSHSVHCHDYL